MHHIKLQQRLYTHLLVEYLSFVTIFILDLLHISNTCIIFVVKIQ